MLRYEMLMLSPGFHYKHFGIDFVTQWLGIWMCSQFWTMNKFFWKTEDLMYFLLSSSTQQKSGSLFYFWLFIVTRGSSFFHVAPNIKYYSAIDLPIYPFYEEYSSCLVSEFIFIENWKGASWPWRLDNMYLFTNSATH